MGARGRVGLNYRSRSARKRMILRRSRFEGRIVGEGLKCISAFRSAATFNRASRLIQRLRNWSRPPHVAQEKNFNFKIAAFFSDLHHVSNVDVATGFCRLLIALDSS
jgi:hypothetical protein